jgi:single-strand DNA-binding protein
MNKVNLIGRLVREPETRYTNGDNSLCVCSYTLAVDRKFKKKDSKDQQADFIRCVAMGKSGEFAEKYFHKGLKIAVCGRIQTGSYTNKDGNKVYTTDVMVEEQEFVESKAASQQNNNSGNRNDGFMGENPIDSSELPFD